MKMLIALVCFLNFSFVLAQTTDFGYLKPEDQQYYKNDSFEGNNKMERIDSAVKEINKLHGEINSMKAEMAQMKLEIEKLKSKK